MAINGISPVAHTVLELASSQQNTVQLSEPATTPNQEKTSTFRFFT